MTLVCMSVGILDGIVNPIYSKNVSFVDVGLVQTCLDLIGSYGWWWGGGVGVGGGGGLSKNLVKPWA